MPDPPLDGLVIGMVRWHHDHLHTLMRKGCGCLGPLFVRKRPISRPGGYGLQSSF